MIGNVCSRVRSASRWPGIVGVMGLLFLGLGPARVFAQEAPAAGERAPTDAVEVFVTFTGNFQADDGTLKDAAKRTLRTLKSSGRTADMYDVAYDIESFYLQRGNPFARVDPQRNPAPPGMTRDDDEAAGVSENDGTKRAAAKRWHVTFFISEGPRVEVVDVRFAGHGGVFDVAELRTFFDNLQTGPFGLGGRWYVADKVNSACSKIEELYRLHGYKKVVVTPPAISDEAIFLTPTDVRLTIHIAEGQQYLVHTVDIFGDIGEDAMADVKQEFSLILGEQLKSTGVLGDFPPFSPALVSAMRARATTYFKDRAHFRPVVDVKTDFDDDTGEVRLKFLLKPGPTYEIGKVEFRNVDQFDESFLRDLVVFEPESGQPYSLEAESKSYQRVMRTNLVAQLRMHTTTREVQTAQGTKHIVDYEFILEERDSVELRIAAGWGSYELLRGSVELIENNIFGIARTLAIRGAASLRHREVEPRFTDPWTLGGDWPYTIKAYYRYRIEPNFTSESIGGTFTIDHRINSAWNIAFGYEISRTSLFNVGSGITITDDERTVRLGSFSTRLTFDTRNSVIDPRDGVFMVVAPIVHTTILGSEVDFLKTTFQISGYVTMVDDALVFGISYQTGLNWKFGARAIPLQERFRNGGQDTVRSFQEGELLRPDEAGPETNGGLVMNVLSVEFRHIIIGPLWGAVFFDMGNLVGSYEEWFNSISFRYAVGYGLRLVTPIGPVRLDFAWNFDRRKNVAEEEDEFVLHFSIGYPF